MYSQNIIVIKGINEGNPEKPVLDGIQSLPEIMDFTQSHSQCRQHGFSQIRAHYPIVSEYTEEKDAQLGFKGRINEFVDENHVLCKETGETLEKPVFIKFAPLLDPNQYLIGKYDDIYSDIRDNLAEFVEPNSRFSKLSSIHNSSYIDSFFSYLSSQLLHTAGFPHALDFYGTFLGIQKNFRFNIYDELEFLEKQPKFFKKEGTAFTVEKEGFVLMRSSEDEDEEGGDDDDNDETSEKRKRKVPLKIPEAHIEDAASLLEFEDIETAEDVVSFVENVSHNCNEGVSDRVDHLYLEGEDGMKEAEPVLINKRNDDSASDNSELNYSTEGEDGDENNEGEGEEWEDNDEDEDEDEDEEEDNEDDEDEDEEDEKIIIHIKDFPTQMICMEKCDGTLDELFMRGTLDEEKSASMAFQIIMILAMYQNLFHFTHNDLHTNNILYCKTTIEFLDYEFQGRRFRVPTHGKIFKIIDFGRSIYTFQGRTYCSDSFAARGDAATQYNCEPFFDPSKPRIEPNRSFDLCRLACSIFDFVIEDPAMPVRYMDDFQRLIHTWCQDDNGKNVLYKKNGEERYPQFKLYKMIARTVHKHVPENYLDHPLFAAFQQR